MQNLLYFNEKVNNDIYICYVNYCVNLKLILLFLCQQEFSPRFGNNFYTAQVLGHSIDGLPAACGGQFALYHIQVKRGKSTWVVKRRFRSVKMMR